MMVWKSASYAVTDYERHPVTPSPLVAGSLIAHVGTSTRKQPVRNHGMVERLPNISDDLLGYNAGCGFVLLRVEANERGFDCYAKLPFCKGMTERSTGKTMLITADLAHHGEAMQGQFDCDLHLPSMESKGYGNVMRWINVGDTKTGFIGLDYRPGVAPREGLAASARDVKFLAKTLLQFGYDSHKKLYLLEPPQIIESQTGKQLRRAGLETLLDWSRSAA